MDPENTGIMCPHETYGAEPIQIAGCDSDDDWGARSGLLDLASVARPKRRRATRRPPGSPLEDATPTTAPSPLELAVGEQTMRRYEAALTRLREPDRELIVGRVELGLDSAELTSLMNKPSLTATRVAVSRALLRLAAEMGIERATPNS